MTGIERLLLVATGYVAVAAAAGGRQGPTVCVYRLFTRRSCPACGLTRSIGRFFRADLRGSCGAHGAGPAIAILVPALTARRFADRRRRGTRAPGATLERVDGDRRDRGPSAVLRD